MGIIIKSFIQYSYTIWAIISDRDHKTSSEADASYYCTDCSQDFKSLQELIGHDSRHFPISRASIIYLTSVKYYVKYDVPMQSSKISAKQKYGEIEENPIGLPQKYCKTIVNQLNEDIASSYVLFLQLRKQHAIIKGPDWKHIHDTLGEYATYIGKQAEELSERLTVLGGLPILILHDLKIWRMSTLKEMIC